MASAARAFKEVAGKDRWCRGRAKFEQTNSSVLIGDKMLLKTSADRSGHQSRAGIGRFLTERSILSPMSTDELVCSNSLGRGTSGSLPPPP